MSTTVLPRIPSCLRGIRAFRGCISTSYFYAPVMLGVLRVTPAIARELLKLNVWNREAPWRHVLPFFKCMLRGHFLPSCLSLVYVRGSTRLKLSHGWALLDAQKRLMAVARMEDPNFSVEFFVTIYSVQGDENYKNLFTIFDHMGIRRSLRDDADIVAKGERWATNPAAWRNIVGALYRHFVDCQTGVLPRSDVEKAQLLTEYPAVSQQLYDLFYTGTTNLSKIGEVKLRKTSVMLAYLRSRVQNQGKSEEFFRRLLSELPTADREDLVPQRCRDMLYRIDAPRGGGDRVLQPGHIWGSPEQVYDTVMAYWTAWHRGDHDYNPDAPPYAVAGFRRTWPAYVPISRPAIMVS